MSSRNELCQKTDHPSALKSLIGAFYNGEIIAAT